MLKPRHGIYYGMIFHAKRNSEIAGSAKTASGHNKNQFLLKGPYELYIIGNRCFREKIKKLPRV